MPSRRPNKKKKARRIRIERITLSKLLLEMNKTNLREKIKKDAENSYKGQIPKEQQLDAVMSLVQLQHTFVMAGTGFGKTRIAEMYLNLFTAQDGVVLVLNPLDALGDNQVAEKIAQGYTAINLAKMTFNQSLSDEILAGVYKFVYLSPETFVDNDLFVSLYYKREFQARLALIVIDEAHIIYSWGLVASGEAKKSSAHLRTHDVAAFRPSYGNMAAQLMANEGVPILFLSATCRPEARKAIFENLKLDSDNVTIIHAELTRPEIRILRFPMEYPLKKAYDLLQLFGPKDEIPDCDLPPTLIYSGTRNATGQILKVVNEARGTIGGEKNPRSTLIRRYHAVTGNLDKVDTISGFEAAEFPSISCTMALGLGQNWSRVRRVIHLGRADPSNICQMIGRCGRDGKPGLAVLFMEKKRKGGKNKQEDFSASDKETDDLRMDSLAITPVCLRICFSLDNLSADDPNVSRERLREELEGFLPCKCSNCEPEEADRLRKHMAKMNLENFLTMCENAKDLEDVEYVLNKKKKTTRVKNKTKMTPMLDALSDTLLKDFSEFFDNLFVESSTYVAEDLFDRNAADSIAKNLDQITTPSSIAMYIGGERILGQLEMLHSSVLKFRQGEIYRSYLSDLLRYNNRVVSEKERLENEMEQKKINTEAKKQADAEHRRVQAAKKKEAAEQEKQRKAEDKAYKKEMDSREKERIAQEKADKKKLDQEEKLQKALEKAEATRLEKGRKQFERDEKDKEKKRKAEEVKLERQIKKQKKSEKDQKENSEKQIRMQSRKEKGAANRKRKNESKAKWQGDSAVLDQIQKNRVGALQRSDGPSGGN
ncbi:ATP-dependent DNA helicase sgs1 [Puccinia graminis f. sp. tritici]|uniref:DNA 3'-5' helicase n=1 Tax=Puccinia graminis f. sp. tritici TaxID=56615 RepID=A0A5B0RR11_PUCGR|nr:ATP-dependent DNA helicase sgs1 [Puccinia graminis f. sp. tritici]